MRYELSHDSIARQIFEKQSEDMRLRRKVKKEISDKYEAFQERDVHLTKDDLSYFKPQLAAIHLSSEEEDFLREEEARLKRTPQEFFLNKRNKALRLWGIVGTGEGVGEWPENIYRYSDEELKELGFEIRK